jgi:RND family efflux transporter MFP subunit
MRPLWRASSIVVVALVMSVAVVPQAGWPKGERPTAVVRSGNGVMRGIVRAATQAMLYTQIQGRVSALPRREGERIEKGETLVQIDCNKYRAELAAAIAEHQAKDRTFANNKELTKLNAVSTLELEISEAEVKKAQAAIRIAELNVGNCRIAAPFSGRITGVMVNEHENVFPNDKLLSLLDDTSLEIELVLPSSSLAWLKRKARFTFTIDETKGEYQAKVKEIGANIDPASQTVKVIGAFEKLPPEVLAGMSGSAEFPTMQP